MTALVRTTCPYCGVGCGVLVEHDDAGAVSVRGDPAHPANFGRLCSKGAALAETIGLEDRLLHPEIGGRRASWDDALDLVAARFSQTIAEHGPDAVAFYVSGQLLTEDYYVANKLMKGFIGSANIDTNSRLCMASAVAGHRRAFGSDTVPGTYEDLELADLVVLVGSNLAWCHPVLYQRLAAAREARPEMRIVLVDPRRTATADIADLHLPLRADGDVALFTGLLAWLADTGALDHAYIDAHTTGLGAALQAARSCTPTSVAEQTGLDLHALTRFYDLFGHAQKVVTVFSQGANQSACGTDKVNAIINAHLATGRIGRPGMGPFSITGQPNAMGGREVGGLANMLAAHMDIENETHRAAVQHFWNAPRIACRSGLKAVDMFRAVADGRVKALWIMATNPAATMPDADAVRSALQACPFVVVSDIVAQTDTLRHAHVKLPAAAWGEKDGTVTNSERRISRQRTFLPLPGEARPDWRIVCDVAARMGFAGSFAYSGAAQIFAEHAALSTLGNGGTRDLDLGSLAALDETGFADLQPVQWPCPPAEARFFANGGFFTPDRKARFVAVTPPAASQGGLVLNTGRVRDHWHTMTRTGKSARLSQHLAEPFAELHPADAAQHGVADADLVRVHSHDRTILVRALLSPRQARGTVFVPMHWTDSFASAARVDALIPAVTDPHSGQPALKHARVRITRFDAARYGFAVVRSAPTTIDPTYWAIARSAGGWRVELAFAADRDWTSFASELFGSGADCETLAYRDAESGQHRIACFAGEHLVGALFLAREPVAVSRSWAAAQLEVVFHERRARFAILAGRSGSDRTESGATVCSCFGVGAADIERAVQDGCTDLATLGQRLQAGTNCGSCRPEIRRIIDAHALEPAE